MTLDIRRIVHTILILAALGFVFVYAQRFMGQIASRAGV